LPRSITLLNRAGRILTASHRASVLDWHIAESIAKKANSSLVSIGSKTKRRLGTEQQSIMGLPRQAFSIGSPDSF